MKRMRRETVAIIGTACRSGRRYDKASIVTTENRVLEQITKWGLDPMNLDLVSGGSAWSDHIAVRLFLAGKVGGLILHFPCKFSDHAFVDNGLVWYKNPGKALNFYHRESFSVMGNTLRQISEAITKGAVVNDSRITFFARNIDIAASDNLIALTFEDAPTTKNPGTFDTWNKCRGRKIHLKISDS